MEMSRIRRRQRANVTCQVATLIGGLAVYGLPSLLIVLHKQHPGDQTRTIGIG